MPDIAIYTTRYCPYCHAAKRLLTRKGVEFTEIDVSGDPKGRSEMVARANGRMTVPQIFIGSTHVGGYDDLSALERAGKRVYPGSTVLPGMLTAATDMAQLRAKGVQSYGIGPAMTEDDRTNYAWHSDVERLSESALYQFVEFTWNSVTRVAASQ